MKVIINKYLKDIGIDEKNYWVISEDHCGDPRYEENEFGIIDAETWNLDSTLAMIIYSYLCYFRDHCMYGHPVNMTFEKWKEIVDTMIMGFELKLKGYDDIPYHSQDEYKQLTKNRTKKINYGLRLFAKYFNDLWW